MKQKLVVIGAGMASGRLLENLVEDAQDVFDITVFNAEPCGTYNRIMLSAVLAGDQTPEDIVTHDADWYARHGITCRFGDAVEAIDRQRQVVRGAVDEVAYDKLVIATGSTPFILPVPGRDLAGVISYRDLQDTDKMIRAAATGGQAVVIGGGLLGLEAAAGLAKRGMNVTVLHLMGHLMERQLDAAAGALLQHDLEARGVKILTEATTQAIEGTDRVEAVTLQTGERLSADLVVMAVGIRPATQIASDAGLQSERGIIVDKRMITSDPNIFALGECVEFEGHLFGLVAPLYDQAKVVAKGLLGHEDVFAVQHLATKLKVTGCDLFSAGDFQDGAGREDIVFRHPANAVYKRLVIEDGRLVGAVMYGDTVDGPWFFDLIRSGRNIEDIRDTLMFGAVYNEGAPPDPHLAVAALPHKAARAGCNGIYPSNTYELKAAA